MIKITTREEFESFKSTFKGPITTSQFYPDRIEINNSHILPVNCTNWVNQNSDEYANDLIFSKDKTRNVVSVEVKNGQVFIYTETSEGVKLETRPFKYWIMSNLRPEGIHTQMNGDLHFKYLKEFDTEKDWKIALGKLWKSQADKYCCYDQRETFMVRHGLTYFKGMKVSDVSVLSFDIETTTLNPDQPDARVLLISNTLKKNGNVVRKLFALDEFKNELTMLQSWCQWVREVDPTVMLGHNIYAFDFPYLQGRIKHCGVTQVGIERNTDGLKLGRDESVMEISDKVSQFRYDGSQQYDYKKISIFGREVVDTFFLAMKYDVGREFPSYGLKPLIEHLGYERQGRIKWDFNKNKPKEFFGKDKELTQQFKEYCNDDADDAIKLYELMIPAYFYWNQTVPKTFSDLNLSATGKQIDQVLIRGYLGVEHSLPKPSEKVPYQGAYSLGIPGVYHNVVAFDFASLYPSIIIGYNLQDKEKDPLCFMQTLTKILREQRLKNKKIAKETGDKKFKDLEQAQKLGINSIYGHQGGPGFLFNSPKIADTITRLGRELFDKVLVIMTGKNFSYWNKGNKCTEDEE